MCKETNAQDNITYKPVLRIRIHMFLGLPDPDPLVRGMDPDPDPDPALDPSIICKNSKNTLIPKIAEAWIRIHPKMSWIRNTISFK